MLDPYFKAMLDAAAAAGAPPLNALGPDAAREVYRSLRLDGEASYPDLDVRDLTVAGGVGPIGARLYTPKAAPTPGPVLVYYHGGGWVIGDLETHDGLCRQLASASGVRVLSVDYRLAPENPFPAAYEDAVAAADWAFDHAAEVGFDPARIGLGGDSAGGNLAAAAAIALRDAGRWSPAFQLLFYPVTQVDRTTNSLRDLAEGFFLTKAGMDWFGDCLFAAGGERADPRVSVLNAASHTGLAPAFVATAGFDPLKDEGREYAERLAAAGVPTEHRHYPGFIHGFYQMAGLSPAAAAAVREAAEVMKAALD
ncbi:MAG: alpha/beta hydrolase [Caulobacteraceae bacterium]|nr:alpha/beta hydrolase [Caulobacteraceae bacterium]